jgi:hypothetical protein
MKRLMVLVAATTVVIGYNACNSPVKEAQQDAENLTTYVDSVDKLTPVYTASYWTDLDNGYQARLSRAESAMAELEAADKAKLEASKAKYEALRATYEANIKQAEAAASTPDFRQVLRNQLFGEGVVGNDMTFAFANADNLLSIYRNFVNTVDANKNTYSREDWDEIKVLYEALDTRKNTVEKDLPKGDNNKIAGLKIKFSSIKATHRGGTKGEENQAAKDKAE